MLTLKLSNSNLRYIMEALKEKAYESGKSYTERLPFLQAYQDIDYKMKWEQRKIERAKRRKEKEK